MPDYVIPPNPVLVVSKALRELCSFSATPASLARGTLVTSAVLILGAFLYLCGQPPWDKTDPSPLFGLHADSSS